MNDVGQAGEGSGDLDATGAPDERPTRRYERLSPQDALFLQIETASQPMHVGGLAIFEGGPFFDDAGRFRLQDLRRAIVDRLHLVPRFRRRLMMVPFDLGRPVWVDDASFDIDDHVRLSELAAPGGFDQLRGLLERLQAQRLDRSRPLWELWFVEGLDQGRVALIQKTHHALIDGISGIDVATVLLDLEVDPAPIEGPAWVPVAPPSDATLLVESLTHRLAAPTDLLRAATRAVRHPERAAEALVDQTLETGRSLATAAASPPPTPWNVPIGPTRRFEVARVPLDRAKRIKNAVGASVNDVVLAICAGAVRSFLVHRGEEVDGISLRTFVPVSLRADDEHLTLGNRVSGLLVDLPVGDPDPSARLRAVMAQMAAVKESGQAESVDRILALTDLAPPAVVGVAARLLARQRTVNLGVTNVPGPQVPLYCMGARMLEVFPYVGVFEQTGLLIGLISYDGALGFGITGDGSSLPDLDVLAAAIETESAVLESAVVGGAAGRAEESFDLLDE